MSAATITVDDVRAAIDALKAQGVADPGVHRIRAYLGRGSVTTINRYKHQIRTEELKRILPGTRKPVPDPVTECAARLWEELNQAIDQIDQQREAEAREELDKLTQAHQALQADLEAWTKENEELTAQLARVKAELAATEKARDQALHDVGEKTQALALAEEHHKTLEQERDHYREQFRVQGLHAQQREEALRKQLQHAEDRRKEERIAAEKQLNEANENARDWRRQFEQQHQYLSGQLAAQTKKHQQALDALRQRETENADLARRLEGVTANLAATERTVQALEDKLAAEQQARENMIQRHQKEQEKYQSHIEQLEAQLLELAKQRKGRLAKKDG